MLGSQQKEERDATGKQDLQLVTHLKSVKKQNECYKCMFMCVSMYVICKIVTLLLMLYSMLRYMTKISLHVCVYMWERMCFHMVL